MKRPLLLLLVCLVLVVTVGAAAAPARHSANDCTWGASSVVVEEVNEQLVQSEPATSGCIPR